MDNMITGCQTPLKMSFDVDDDFKNELIDALTWKEWNLQEVNQVQVVETESQWFNLIHNNW